MSLFTKFSQVIGNDAINELPKPDLTQSSVESIVSIAASILGFISVLVIIIAGIKFITSQGEPQKIANARNTIIYAAIGLVVSILAYTIVNFVISGVT